MYSYVFFIEYFSSYEAWNNFLILHKTIKYLVKYSFFDYLTLILLYTKQWEESINVKKKHGCF